MASFTFVPTETVIPAKQPKTPSQRAQIAKMYQDAMAQAFEVPGQALVIEIEDGDKPLTIKNRLERAGEALGIAIEVKKVRKEPKWAAYRVGEPAAVTTG